MGGQFQRLRRPRTEQSALLPIALTAILVVAIIAAMFFLSPDPRDPITFCPKGGAKSVTAIILDTSDPLEPHQIAAFNKFVDSLIRPPQIGEAVTVNSDSNNYVQRGQLLVAYEIANKTGQPRLLFKQCSPGDPESRDVGRTLTEGEILAKIRWSKFSKELINAFPKKTLGKTAPISPIIETMRYVRRSEFPSSFELKASGQTAGVIFIISDMLQNSDRLTHFDGEFPEVKNVPAVFALDLTGIEVGIRYLKLERYAHLQRPLHFTWWRKFFAVAGSPLNRPPEAW